MEKAIDKIQHEFLLKNHPQQTKNRRHFLDWLKGIYKKNSTANITCHGEKIECFFPKIVGKAWMSALTICVQLALESTGSKNPLDNNFKNNLLLLILRNNCY